jgi:hypothetical protein
MPTAEKVMASDFGTFKVSRSSIFWQNNKLSTQLLIPSFLKTEFSVRLLHVTTGTLKEMHWEVLPHPAYSPDLASSDFHLFGHSKSPQKGKDLLLTMKLNFLCKDGWTNNKL